MEEKEEIQSRSLLGRFSLRKDGKGEKSYVEIFLIPSVAILLSAIIMVSLLLHVMDFGGVALSTKAREKLTASIQKIQIIDNAKAFKTTENLKISMTEFYNATGVSPCVYTLSEGEGTTASEAYYQNCASENCFFVMLDPKTNQVSAVSGNGAASVMDAEAYEIFSDYVLHYENIAESDEELLEYSLNATATRIMRKTNLFNCVPAPYYYGIIIAVLIILFFSTKVKNDLKIKNKDKK